LFSVIFNEAVTGFDSTDLILAGTTPGTLSAAVTGNGAIYTVAVSGMRGSGDVTASVKGDAATDAAGNRSLASSAGATVRYNAPPPSVSAIDRIDPTPTNAATVRFAIRFSQSVTGVDATDFALVASGITGASVNRVAGSGATFTVTVTTGIGAGNFALRLIDDDTSRGCFSV
jgi:hypothetical protein